MAKKITFLLVLLLGLMIASVSAYATTDTATTAPDTGLTKENSSSVGTNPAINPENTQPSVDAPSQTPSAPQTGTAQEEDKTINYEQYISQYLDPEAVTTENILVNIKWNQRDPVNNPLDYVLTGTVKQDSEKSSPLIVMLYIKADGVYIPLIGRNGTNIIEADSVAFVSRTDLLYLGSDKINEVRIIAFRKEDRENLVPGVNLQITNKLITAKKTVIIPVPIDVDSVLDALKLK